MEQLLEVWMDAPDPPRLEDVLEALGPGARDVPWLIFDLGEVHRPDGSSPDVMLDRVFASNAGLPVTYAELLTFARSLSQVIDGLFLGGAVDVSRSATIAENAHRSTHLVAAVDSTSWLLGGPPDTLTHIQSTFPTAHPTSPGRLDALDYWS